MEEKKRKQIVLLSKFFPDDYTAEVAYNWIQEYKFRFVISKARSSKFGDYRPPFDQQPFHRISVNHNLNKYAFLITFCHEVAHLIVWSKHRGTVQPHGAEWKTTFSQLLFQFMEKNVFPLDVNAALVKSIENPKASSCTDINLFKVLSKYDANPATHLSDIPQGSVFKMNTGRVFEKGIKKRTRYLCKDLSNNKQYWINGIADVEVVKNPGA